jgi:hypothetical protein
MQSFPSMRVVSWAVVGALLTGIIAVPLWQADGLSLDRLLDFSLPICLFALPILTLRFWLHELQDSVQIPQGTSSLHSARAPPVLARV